MRRCSGVLCTRVERNSPRDVARGRAVSHLLLRARETVTKDGPLLAPFLSATEVVFASALELLSRRLWEIIEADAGKGGVTQ